MTDFMACAPPYEGWRDRKVDQERLLLKLVNITKENVRRSFSTLILLDDWRRVDEKYSLRECHLTPPARKAFIALHSIPHEWGYMDEERILKVCDGFEVPKRGQSVRGWSPFRALKRQARAAAIDSP